MALYQPSNITPSSFAGLGQGVVSASRAMIVSWQVNGNSPMTAFNIQIYRNNANSSFVGETGIISISPFYGRDQKGNPRTYTYTGSAWSEYGIDNGEEYKLKITQYWGENNENSVVQLALSAFIARSIPSVAFLSLPSSYTSIRQSFYASYLQAEGDAINWCRWEFARVDANGQRDIIDDTGEVNTGVLEYTADGLLSGQTYAIRCTVQAATGIEASTGWETFTPTYESDMSSEYLDAAFADDGSVLIPINADAGSVGVPSPTSAYGSFDGEGLLLNEGASVTWDKLRNGDAINITAPYSVGWRGDVSGLTKRYQEIFDFPRFNIVISKDGSTAIVEYYSTNNNGDVTSYHARLFRITPESMTLAYSIPVAESIGGLGNITGSEYWYISKNGAYAILQMGNRLYAFHLGESESTFIGNYEYPYENDITGLGLSINAAVFSDDGKKFFVGTITDETLSTVGGVIYFELTETSFTYKGFAVQKETGYFPSYLDMQGSVLVVSGVSVSSNTAPVRVYFVGESVVLNDEYFADYGAGSWAIAEFLDIDEFGPYDMYVSVTHGEKEFEGYLTLFSDVMTEDKNAWRGSSTWPYTFYDDDDNIIARYMPTLESRGEPMRIFSFPSGSSTRLFKVGENEGGISILGIIAVSEGYLTYYTKNCLSENAKASWGGAIVPKATALGVAGTDFQLQGREAIVSLSPSSITVTFLDNNGNVYATETKSVSPSSPTINSLSIYGYGETKWFCVKEGYADFSSFIEENPHFTPQTAFLSDLSRNNLNAYLNAYKYSDSFLYRLHDNDLQNLTRVDISSNRIKDFGAKSNEDYVYELAQLKEAEVTIFKSQTVGQRFTSYYLIEATADEEQDGVYHALKIWRFGNNVVAGTVGNNNTPSFLNNFTPYRLRQPSSRAGRSGTLQALISNAHNGKYRDTASQMEELYAISQSKNTFFLKDTKGNIFMVHTSAPIVQNISLATSNQEVSVSIPWEEIGSTKGVSVIQLPTDEGWQNNEIESASLDVDVETGVLYATYPEEYFGTTFRMEGATLFAVTRSSIPEASVELVGNTVYAES